MPGTHILHIGLPAKDFGKAASGKNINHEQPPEEGEKRVVESHCFISCQNNMDVQQSRTLAGQIIRPAAHFLSKGKRRSGFRLQKRSFHFLVVRAAQLLHPVQHLDKRVVVQFEI